MEDDPVAVDVEDPQPVDLAGFLQVPAGAWVTDPDVVLTCSTIVQL